MLVVKLFDVNRFAFILIIIPLKVLKVNQNVNLILFILLPATFCLSERYCICILLKNKSPLDRNMFSKLSIIVKPITITIKTKCDKILLTKTAVKDKSFILIKVLQTSNR